MYDLCAHVLIQNSNDLSERVWIENKIQRHVIDKINELRGVTEDEKNLKKC